MTSEIGLNIERYSCSIQLGKWLIQGIIDSAGEVTFTKEPKLAKLLRELKLTPVRYHKKRPLVFLVCLQE